MVENKQDPNESPENTKKITFERILEFIPGFLIWVFLLSPVWGGISIPYLIINLLVVLSVYWLFRATVMSFGIIIGYFKYSKAIKTNWLNEINSLDFNNLPNPETLTKNTKLPKHLIVIANYGESYDILKRSITALTNQNYPKELIYVAVSIEERKAKKDPEYANRGEFLKKDFGDFFGDRLSFFVHPGNIAGEAVGAASNRSWGTKNSVQELEKRGEDISEFLITAPDGDLVFHKEFLGALTYKWLTIHSRNNHFYQTAVYTFNNNYWDVPILIRVLMISLTLPVLASSVFEKHKKETWSCFTLNLKLMKNVNYWDTTISVGADDTTFYWRPYFYLKGEWQCEVFYVPLSADAVYDPNYVKNHIDQYKQYLRWGWGVITFPLAIKQLIPNKDIGLLEKISKIYHLFEVFVFWKVLAFLIAFGIPIVLFINPEFNRYVIAYTVPQTVSSLLSLATILLIPTTIFKVLLIPPKPKKMSRFRFILTLLIEAPLNIIALYTYSFIPFVDATTRMMFGSKTKKVTWSEKTLAPKSELK